MDSTNQSEMAQPQEEKTIVSIGVQTEQTVTFRRKLDLDKSISTPPSELRKQIYYLRDELSEAYEFHDLELQVLKENFCTTESKTDEKNVNDLEKSLKDAEQIILEANREISNLRTANQDLHKMLEDECNKYEAFKSQLEEETSKLQITLKKKDAEIENLKKDKEDFDFRLEVIHQNYNRKIGELKLALNTKNEKESDNERNLLLDELQRKLSEENENTRELSKKLEDLNVELLLNKEKVKLLEEQLGDSSERRHSGSLRDISLQTEMILEEKGKELLKNCSSCERHEEANHESSIDGISINLLFKEIDTSITNNETEQRGLVDVSVQMNGDSPDSAHKKIEEIRCSFEKEIKELKDEHNNKLKSLENRNENLQQSNLSLTEKLNASNEIVEELKEKLLISIESVEDLRRQLEELRVSKIDPVNVPANDSSQDEITENTHALELERKIKELQCENEKLHDSLSSLSEKLESAQEDIEALKQKHEKELKTSNHHWEFKVEGLKLEKETLNSIISNKDEKLNILDSELTETKNKLEETELNLKTYVKDNERYIDLLTSEKEELQNWIKMKEDEMNNLNIIVENELIKLKAESELKIEEVQKMYEVEIKNLKNENDELCEQIESIRNMYETEVLKFVNLIQNEKTKKTVDRAASPLKEIGKCSYEGQNDTILIPIIQKSNAEEFMSLVPIRSKGKYSDETIGNYNLHTVDEENMQLKVNSESAMMDFINEFTKEMLRENIINPEELKTCTNVFYSLLNKYLILFEMYTRLKEEFEAYKASEEEERFDIVNKTVRYLDTLCSQLEVSGSSLNLSNSSFLSFHEGLPSSTIMEQDYTEMEISAVNNVTMSKDPLSLTQDVSFKTPLKTPYKSAKKPNQFLFKTPLRSVSKSVKTPMKPESIKKPILRTPASARPEKFSSETQLMQLKNNIVRKDKELTDLKDLYNMKIGSAEDIIQKTLKNLALLEKRIAKLETISGELQTQRENLMKENVALRESLTKNSEEISEIREKLIVETISLNHELEGTFTEVSVTNLLSIFIHTIMESCKKMPEELSDKLMSEIETLTEKNEMYESQIFESRAEMNLLKGINAALMEKKEIIEREICDRNEEIKKLKQETSELKVLKSKVKDLEERLMENDSVLQTEIYLKENTLKDLQKLKTFFEDAEKENSCLKEKIEQSDRAMHDLKKELMLAKKEQMNSEMKEGELMKEIERMKCILSDTEGKNKDLQNMIGDFEEAVSSVKSKNKYKTCQLELLNNKITNTENLIQERDQIILELRQKINEMEEKLESKSQEFLDIDLKYKNSQTEIEEFRRTVDGYKESVNEDIEKLKNKVSVRDVDLSSKMKIIQELCSQLEDAKENARVKEETIISLKERVEQLENEKQHMKEETISLKEQIEQLENEKQRREEETISLKEQIEQLENEKQHMKKETISLKEQIEQSENEKQRREEETISLKEQIEQLENEKQRREEETISLKEQIEQLENEKQREEEETITSLKERVEQLENEKQRREEETISLKERVEQLENEKQPREEETISLKEQIEQLENEMQRREEETTSLKEQIEQLENEKQREEEETITSLKERVEQLENEKQVLKALESELEKHVTTGKVMADEIGQLKAKLKASETELTCKITDVEKLSIQLMEAEEVKLQNEETISTMKRQMEELEGSKTKLRSMESAIEQYKEIEKLMAEETESLKSKLLESEAEVKDKIQELAEMTAVIEKTKENQIKDEELISLLKIKVQDMETDRARLEELEAEIEKLRETEKNLEFNSSISSLKVAPLKAGTAKLQSKNKMNRKSDLCNRKLDRLEELHQSVTDLLKNILRLIGLESLNMNIITMRQFEIESKKIWDYFTGWVSSKTKEVEDLKSQLKELDEECESYAKVITDATQETERVWEKSRTEVNNLKLQITNLEEENRVLRSETESLREKLKVLESGRDVKNNPENGTELTEELRKENIALQTRIKNLEESLSQARMQIEELDEECESYAKVIKENQRESLLSEEIRNEINALNEEIGRIMEERDGLRKEKEALQEKIRMLESSNDKGKKDWREVNELKRTVALREMKILELEQLNEKNIIHKSQIKYLESSLAVLKDQLAQEESKNRKLQKEVEDLSKNQKRKGSDDVELLDQLRTRDTLGMATSHQIDDKEKLQKLEKDNRMLKEVCRSRYNEIKRLETENLSLKGHERTTKNSNQMDSPIRTRYYNKRNKKY